MASLVKVTERVSCLINDVLNQENLPDVIQKELKYYQQDNGKNVTEGLPFDVLYKAFKYSTRKEIYLHEILEGSEVYFPPLKEPERNPELLARLEQLKAEQENKQYKLMTRNVNADAYGDQGLLAGVRQEVRSVKAQLMGVFNVVLTVLGAFTFGFMASYYAGKPAAYCVVVGFIFGLTTAAADLYFFIKNEL
ncbi:transmembrane protein 199-like [Amphiura filiformis]|uniref:transmembrane protein 199-like n=1 Tax=Amphiura filiformis TaxID=82378 RepID=UPI003B217E56